MKYKKMCLKDSYNNKNLKVKSHVSKEDENSSLNKLKVHCCHIYFDSYISRIFNTITQLATAVSVTNNAFFKMS